LGHYEYGIAGRLRTQEGKVPAGKKMSRCADWRECPACGQAGQLNQPITRGGLSVEGHRATWYATRVSRRIEKLAKPGQGTEMGPDHARAESVKIRGDEGPKGGWRGDKTGLAT